jgi:peptidoglycan/xylan/chitin deacetylase (PgdA/CDA1 family)
MKTSDRPSALALLYHELRETPAAYSYVLSCAEFSKQLVLFDDLEKTGTPHYEPIITFDDGHVSNHRYALPMLQQHGRQAHFFITAGWTGQRDEYMGWEQLRELHAAGQVIGAHGWSHKLLTHCTDAELDRELRGARERLEDGLGATVDSLSLPGGRADRRVFDACQQAGYTMVWTSEPRAETRPLGATVGRFNIRGDVTVEWLNSFLNPASGVLKSVHRSHALKAAAKRLMGDRLYAKLWSVMNRQEQESDPAAQDGEAA